MYASIRKYYLIPGTVEQFMRRVQEGFVPLISRVPGFRVYYVLQVRDDEVISVSIFDSQAGAEESVRRAADWVAKNLSSFIQGLPEVTVGYVRIFQFQGEQTASREEMLREQLFAAQNP
ncbi:MAG TPA: antibiotic biosynthesis monooxygenase [Ktedonobacteraceae bacterium]|nr:antibiotic biosynthesis monooxygenase [Ktedonobacteraceae bacterium]